LFFVQKTVIPYAGRRIFKAPKAVRRAIFSFVGQNYILVEKVSFPPHSFRYLYQQTKRTQIRKNQTRTQIRKTNDPNIPEKTRTTKPIIPKNRKDPDH
jgi:hypothetical protein